MRPYTELPRARVVYGRKDAVCERCTGKRVLHLGCVDAGLVEERIDAGELMHLKLSEVAADLWGVDIDAGGIAFLKSRGFHNLHAGDIVSGLPALTGEQFDVIVLTEVLEHLDNPGMFLDAVHALMVPGRTELIVTVPNAYRIDSLLSMWHGVENVHPDHNYWFSYHTVTTLMKKRGLDVAEVLAYSLQPGGVLPDSLAARPGEVARPSSVAERPGVLPRALAFLKTLPRRILVSVLYRRSAFWADGIMVIARRQE